MSLQIALPGITTRRPKENDADILADAVRKRISDITSWLSEPDSDELRASVTDALKATGGRHADAYKLARYLEQHCGWDPDADLVETLDGVIAAVHDVYGVAVRQWVEANRITLKLTIGTEIHVPTSLKHISNGPWTIRKMMPEIASYGIAHPGMPETSYYYAIAEDVVPADAAVSGAEQS